MRLDEVRFGRVGCKLRFLFEGSEIEAFAGETIAAALSSAHIVDFRDGKSGDRRGMFCGMGVCFECLVSVDGRDNVRACLETVAAGSRVERQRYPGRHSGLAATAKPPELLSPDVAIVGAGPAGLSAALALQHSGLDVLLLDEREKPGGQYFKQPNAGLTSPESALPDAQYRSGADLIRLVRASNVQLLEGSFVWGAFAPLSLSIVARGRNIVCRPKALIVATGAYERGVPAPGWTLPGTMTTGAVQSLIRSHRTAPGSRIVVAGNGPLNVQVAAELVAGGATVMAVIEAAHANRLTRLPSTLAAFVANPRLMLAGLKLLAFLKARGVPVYYGHVVKEMIGEARVTSVRLGRLDEAGKIIEGAEKVVETDIVCVGYGFEANDEIPRLLGAETTVDPTTSRRRLVVDGSYQTSVPGLFVIGDALRLQGARVALAQGTIAADAVSKMLQGSGIGVFDRLRARWRLRMNLLFQKHIWRLFRTGDLLAALATPDTIICRCEGVTLADIQAEVRSESSIGNVKRATRAGMGRCQGRYCGPFMEQLIHKEGFYKPTHLSGLAPRPPMKPVLIADIASEPDFD